MRNEGTVASSKVGRRNVKKRRRIENPRTTAIPTRRRRGQPQKHLLRPLVEAAIGTVRECDAVCRIHHAIRRRSTGLKPGCEKSRRYLTRGLWVGGHRLCPRHSSGP